MSLFREEDRVDSCLPAISNRPLSASALNQGPLLDRDRRVRFVSGTTCERGRGLRDGAYVNIRPISPTYNIRRQATDPVLQQANHVQEQIQQYREEIAKKDRLISQLTGVNGSRIHGGGFAFGQMEDAFASTDGLSMSAGRSDVALCVRIETLQNQVRELQAQLEVKEDKIRELKILNDTCRDSEDKNGLAVQQLRHQLLRYESAFGKLEDAASRSGIAIFSLQDDAREARQRIVELESRLRTHLEERENAEQDRAVAERNLSNLTTELCRLLFVEYTITSDPLSTDEIIRKAEDMTQENAMLKGKLATMKDYVGQAELEQQTNRETIARLMFEAEREQKSVSRCTLDMENLIVERDTAISRQEDLLKEIDVLRERLEASQRAWSSMRNELEEQRQQVHHDVDRALINQSVEGQHKAFKECLAQLLSDGYVMVEPYEETIRERIQNLVLGLRDKNAQIESLEKKFSNTAAQLETQYDLNRSGEVKTKRAEADLLEMEDRLRRAENSLSTDDVLRDGCRISQDRLIRLLERVAQALNMAPFAVDMGLESVVDAIAVRAEQITSCAVDNDRKVHIYNLQRKVKSLKEQLECKETHLEMCQQKLAMFEEKLLSKPDLEKDEFAKNRKLLKLVDKYKTELNEAHLEIRDLKARLLQATDIQMQTIAKEGDMEKLEDTVGQLEHMRQKHEHTIANLKETVRAQEQSQSAVQSLASELHTTKLALDELTKHHRQLLDLRRVMARMLGLDVSTVAIPDFEMISRLEKLILANRANTSSSVVFDSSVEDMVDEFRRGYQDVGHSAGHVERSRSQGQKVKVGSRSRSLSPLKRKDPKVY